MPSDPLPNDPGSGTAIGWFEHSPFIAHLGMELVSLEPGQAELKLPFADTLPTLGDVVHGGAIASLIDTAAAMAAWSGAEPPEGAQWGTVGMSLNYLAPARACDVVARASVTRRGRTLSFLAVEVTRPDGVAVASALVTYRLG